MRFQQIELFGKPFLVDPDDSLNLVKWGTYEPDETRLVQSVLGEGKRAVDIGAHIGYYSCAMASTGASVIAYEPNPFNYAFLRYNTSHYDNAYASRMGLSDQEGYYKLYLSPINSGDDTLYPFDDLARIDITVPFKVLDDEILSTDLLKIDVQGSELKVLRGMSNLLKSGAPLIMAIEFFPDALRAAGDNPVDMLTLLWQHNFRLQEIHEGQNRLSDIDSPSFADREDLKHGYTNLWCVRE